MTTLNEYEWPSSFWSEFINKYWEQHPTSFTCPAEKPFINMEELFEVVTHMPIRVPADRFWIARNSTPKSTRDFTMGALSLIGPQPTDLNFEGYFRRLGKHTTGINIHNLDKAKPDLWNRVQGFTKSLSKVDNKPPAKYWDLDTFFGTYRATPFGIHKDPASVFVFSLMGERTYCTWEYDYFERGDEALQTPDLEKVRPHLNNAETFILKPGEIFYWPSNRWHVVMSDGKPSVVAQISAYFDPKHLGHWDLKTPGY